MADCGIELFGSRKAGWIRSHCHDTHSAVLINKDLFAFTGVKSFKDFHYSERSFTIKTGPGNAWEF